MIIRALTAMDRTGFKHIADRSFISWSICGLPYFSLNWVMVWLLP